jgi:hypothetical protein
LQLKFGLRLENENYFEIHEMFFSNENLFQNFKIFAFLILFHVRIFKSLFLSHVPFSTHSHAQNEQKEPKELIVVFSLNSADENLTFKNSPLFILKHFN